MKALTIKQPWAFCITNGTKRIENRSWETSYRGLLAIHAGARSGWDTTAAQENPCVRTAWEQFLIGQGFSVDDAAAKELLRKTIDLDFSAVVAVAELANCHTDACSNSWCRCSPWAAPGEFHWELASVRPLPEPVPCKGALGLWNLPGDVEEAVLAQLTEKENAQ